VNQSVNYFVDGFSKKNPWWFFIWGKIEELLELKYIVSLYLHFAYVHAQLSSHVYRIVLGFGRLAHQASRFCLNRSLVQVSLIALQSIYFEYSSDDNSPW
jgi:hypothetical protein